MELWNFRRGRHLYSVGRPSRWASARVLVMVAVWNRADHHIFILSFVLSSSVFFPRLISAAADWMPAILPHIIYRYVMQLLQHALLHIVCSLVQHLQFINSVSVLIPCRSLSSVRVCLLCRPIPVLQSDRFSVSVSVYRNITTGWLGSCASSIRRPQLSVAPPFFSSRYAATIIRRERRDLSSSQWFSPAHWTVDHRIS